MRIGEPVRRQLFILILLQAFHLCPDVRAGAGVIVDMKGRRVAVPQKIEKVYCASLPETNIIYALDPSLLAGWNVPPTDEDKRYLNKKALNLPVLGGWFGQGQTANFEVLMKADPDLVFLSQWEVGDMSARSEPVLKKLGKPIVYIKVFDLDDYPATFLFLGRLLGKGKRAARLAAYAEETLGGVKKTVGVIPDRNKVRVYYAEGPDGLSTECTRSWHTELVNLAGGRNVHNCSLKKANNHDMEKVTMEQVLIYDPEVILIRDPAFFSRIFADSRWKNIRAVHNGRVYLTPRALFSWFDRPPSFMRLLGLKWLTHLLYPDRYRIDMVRETKYFYRLFLNVDLSDGQTKRIMNL